MEDKFRKMRRYYIDKKRAGRKRHLVAFLSLAILCYFSVATTAARQTQTTGEGIQVHRNLRYGEKPKGIGQDTTSDRTLDLYLPEEREGKLPVFMFVHGGGFAGGDKGNAGTQAFCTKLAKHGFAVISINYYLTLKHEKTAGVSCTANMSKGLPTKGFHPKLQEAVKNASSDAQLALQWIKDNTDTYRLDLSSVVISGGSAGAMTALYTAYASDQTILPIQAVVNLWGGLENSNHIKSGAPALLTYHGDQDKLIHVDYAYDLEKKMKETGNSMSETHVFAGKGHAIYNYITAKKTDEIVKFLRKVLVSDGSSVSKDNQKKAQTIGTIAGIEITKEELQREMRKYRAEVYRSVNRERKGANAVDLLRERALTSLKILKVQEKMLMERDIWPYKNYQEFLTDMEQNNHKREHMVADNQVIYGPVTFNEQTFFDYRFHNALIQLKYKLLNDSIITVTQQDMENKFEKMQQTVYQEEKYKLKDFTRQVKEAYVEDAYANLVSQEASQAEVAIDRTQLNQITLNN